MKKLLSLLLVMTMLITSISVFATDAQSTVTAYVTVSKHGEFEKCDDGTNAILLPVELSGKDAYTLDDLFTELHALYNSVENYSSDTNDFGAYITAFWGDTSGNFGYQINGGTESVMGLTHPVKDGDYVDVAIYKNFYPHTEAYTKFNTFKAETQINSDFELTLYEAGYDEDWNTVFSPCADATITVNGEEYGTTDVDGNIILCFEDYGNYIISAHKTKTVNEDAVPAITAPICEINISEPEYFTVMRNIATKYSDTQLATDINMVWFICDLAVYNELNTENQIIISDKIKQECIDKIIDDADKTTAPGSLAKDILALRAMGFDPQNTYNSKSQTVNIVKKLTDLVDSQNEAVTNIYTLPYVIIALRQGENYATEEQLNYLIDNAISSKELWFEDEWGTDAISAMLLALAPYCDTNEDVKNVCDTAIEILTSSIDENGITGNAAATGLAVTALSAFNTDSMEIGLINGLLSTATEALDGFVPEENTFSTEQGFRGLLAWQLFVNATGKTMYDFSSYPENQAISTKKPSSGGGSGGGGGSRKPSNTKKEDTKTEEAPVKTTPNNDVKIMPITLKGKTFEDIIDCKEKSKIESLAERGIINGKTSTNFDPYATMTRAEFATIIARGLGLPSKEKASFNDVKTSDWFYEYINTAYYYGIVNGVSETEFDANGTITRQEAAVMIARASKLCGLDTSITKDDTKDILALFTDYTTLADWATESVAVCLKYKILNDKEIEIKPYEFVKREEIASMVYNMLEEANLLQEDKK